VGEIETVKVPVEVPVTVSDTLVLTTVLPDVPVTVIEYVPATAVEATVNASVDEPEPGAAIEVGVKAAVTPVGRPVAVSAIAASNPSTTAVVIVVDPLLPCLIDSDVGEAAMVKVGVCVVPDPVSVLIRPAPLGLPQPVTRSYPVTAE